MRKNNLTSCCCTMTTQRSSESEREKVKPAERKNDVADHRPPGAEKGTRRNQSGNDVSEKGLGVLEESSFRKENVRTAEEHEEEESEHAAAAAAASASTGEDSGRERLKRHRVEVAGQVWIPDIWGQEELLKDWIDCSVFDAAVVNKSITSAREALAEEGRRAQSTRLRIENSC